MTGNAKCSFQSESKQDQHYENVVLTFVSEDRVAILAKPGRNEPEDVLTLECAHINILSSSHLELEGFTNLEEQDETFVRCLIEFFPNINSEQEAA